MVRITKEAVRAAFDVATRIREGELTGPRGLTILEKEYGFNKNSAETYIHVYDCMCNRILLDAISFRRGTRCVDASAVCFTPTH
jgi:hypothetical protein